MLNFLKPVAAGTVLAIGMALPAIAADLYSPPVYEAPSQPEVVYPAASIGGWYIRGDLGYRHSRMKGVDYTTYDAYTAWNPNPPFAPFSVPVAGSKRFDKASLRNSLSIGAGVGYQINHYLRTDFTADYWRSQFRGSTSGSCGFPAVPCRSKDTSRLDALVLLANAYVDLGTYNRITPYVGAGIGGAYVKWDKLRNQIPSHGVDVSHEGAKGMRFAWALMAGASYCLTNNWHADLGYRFTNISSGRMFQYATGAGPGFHKNIQTHEVRAGLRYQFGGSNGGCEPEPQVVYKDTYEPISPPVYK